MANSLNVSDPSPNIVSNITEIWLRLASSRAADGDFAGGFDDHALVAELLVAPLEQVVDLAPLEVAQGFGDVLFEAVGGGVGVAVGAAEGFLDDRIDHAQLHQVFAG